MHNLIAISPLGASSPQIDIYDGLSISECTDWALASLAARRGQERQCAKAASEFLGFKLPDVGQLVQSDTISAFWIGPNQWMIEAPHNSHEDLAMLVKQAVTGAGSVTEQTDGWARFDLEGPRCHDALERVCNADIRTMPQGQATRTRLEHLGCFLLCRETDTHFSILGPRSSAGSLYHALTTAAKSVI